MTFAVLNSYMKLKLKSLGIQLISLKLRQIHMIQGNRLSLFYIFQKSCAIKKIEWR